MLRKAAIGEATTTETGVGRMSEVAPRTQRTTTPYPDGPSASDCADSSDPESSLEMLFECQVCGLTFTLVSGADGLVLPDVPGFLALHRRCVRRILLYGGALARPTSMRKRGR